jgi:hypothetical protein
MLSNDIFEMGGGFVLDFSDGTSANFFAEELSVDMVKRESTCIATLPTAPIAPSLSDGKLSISRRLSVLKCTCNCPGGCGSRLVARTKATRLSRIFAHYCTACGGAPETALHKFAKQIVKESHADGPETGRGARHGPCSKPCWPSR